MSLRMMLTQTLSREQTRLERRPTAGILNPLSKSNPLARHALLPEASPWEGRLPDLREAERRLFDLRDAGYKVTDPEWEQEESESTPAQRTRTHQAEVVLRQALGVAGEPGPIQLGQSLPRMGVGGGSGVRLRSLQLLNP
ncbi:MAG: hypothetical protein KF760_08110 [Candidatus Eremiobacteraeota bacterium]|nr:hypothetical protein [Candidatus Eremiobacteraeota bacterium]